ncbi:hypothetical protein ACP275_13G062400 [Erythranthe tilingii]
MELSIFVPYFIFKFSISTLISLFPKRALSLHLSPPTAILARQIHRPPFSQGKKGILLLWWSTSVLCWVTEASPCLPWYAHSDLGRCPTSRYVVAAATTALKGSATLPLLNVNITSKCKLWFLNFINLLFSLY